VARTEACRTAALILALVALLAPATASADHPSVGAEPPIGAEHLRQHVKIWKKQAKAWANGTPRMWAIECWQMARDVVYRDIPADGNPPAITEEYIAKAQPLIDEQIQKAGVRLAAALNLAFR